MKVKVGSSQSWMDKGKLWCNGREGLWRRILNVQKNRTIENGKMWMALVSKFPSPSPRGSIALVDLGLPIIEALRSRPVRHTPHSVRLLWTSYHPDAETSAWQHTTLTRDRHPCHRRDSNPQSQQTNGHRLTPYTSWPWGSKLMCKYSCINNEHISVYQTHGFLPERRFIKNVT
jgi:hypothetical protein